MCETARSAGVCRLSLPGRWLATGPDGGYSDAEAAHIVSVPEPFERTDPAAYAAERVDAAGFETGGPALLTGVDDADARGATSGSVTVVATTGLSNPARLPVPPAEATGDTTEPSRPAGTVNLLVGTTRALADGTLATLLGTVVEAKTATLVAETGFTGTTSDAVVVGAAAAGEPAEFAGSGTPVGDAARACVREAVRASLQATPSLPESVADAEHGVRTDRTATVFEP